MAEADAEIFDYCEYREVCEHLCERFGVASTEEVYWMNKMAEWLECSKCEHGKEQA